MEAFTAQPAAPVVRKLDVLMDLEQLRDPRALPFLLHVLRDRDEPLEVRMRIARLLRAVRCSSDARALVGRELACVLADGGSPELRVAAALTLAGFTEIDGVASTLGAVALDPNEPLDLRYSAFTSLERAGPTSESAALLRRLARDETLGPSARSLLMRWHVA